MSKTFRLIVELVADNNVLISEHGYDELAADNLFARDIVNGVRSGIVVEDYPDYHKGPSILVLQRDRDDRFVHVVWGIPTGTLEPAVVVTAYRPDPDRWSEDFLNRK